MDEKSTYCERKITALGLLWYFLFTFINCRWVTIKCNYCKVSNDSTLHQGSSVIMCQKSAACKCQRKKHKPLKWQLFVGRMSSIIAYSFCHSLLTDCYVVRNDFFILLEYAMPACLVWSAFDFSEWRSDASQGQWKYFTIYSIYVKGDLQLENSLNLQISPYIRITKNVHLNETTDFL